MTVDPATTKHRLDHAGQTWSFCCARCREKFASDPAAYHPPMPPAPPPPAGRRFTCPMHPEVRQNGPGSCPLCGMALEPVAPTAEPTPTTN